MTSVNDMPADIVEAAKAAIKAAQDEITVERIESSEDHAEMIRTAFVGAVSAVIHAERQRCLDIIAAEREWGDCHPDDITSRIEAGQQARQIPGWNCPSEA